MSEAATNKPSCPSAEGSQSRPSLPTRRDRRHDPRDSEPGLRPYSAALRSAFMLSQPVMGLQRPVVEVPVTTRVNGRPPCPRPTNLYAPEPLRLLRRAVIRDS